MSEGDEKSPTQITLDKLRDEWGANDREKIARLRRGLDLLGKASKNFAMATPDRVLRATMMQQCRAITQLLKDTE